jgi:hypothetical protein
MGKAGEEASEWCGPSDASGRMSSSISVFLLLIVGGFGFRLTIQVLGIHRIWF